MKHTAMPRFHLETPFRASCLSV